VAAIDEDGFMQITDRSKDVIKSGGEWISSIDLENIAMAHPAVLPWPPAIACRHPKWDERPLLVVVKKAGAELTREQMLQFFDGKIAKWQIPDDVVFVPEIPLGGHRQDAEAQVARAVQGPPTAQRVSALARDPCPDGDKRSG
jgi:acyl-CoA synthetase (AMP-forming)/AMP-acid ligase II